MADQKRWFKLWVTAPSDDALQGLSPALRWAWVALGCYTKVHGTRGSVTIAPTNAVLAAEMGVTVADLENVISLLPHVQIEKGKRVDGEFTVTWINWRKYQEDSTVAERMKTLRSKKRREEKRREYKTSDAVVELRHPPTDSNGHDAPTPSPSAPSGAPARPEPGPYPEPDDAARERIIAEARALRSRFAPAAAHDTPPEPPQ